MKKELYRLLIDNSLQGMLILQDERVVLVNRAVSAVSGYTQQELLSLSLNDLMAIVHQADQERIFNGIGNILSGNSSPVRHEFRIVRKDGSIRWVDTLASNINYQNRPALQLAYLDITERKQAEEELRVSRDRFKTIFARAGMGIVVANIMGCIEDCNVAFSEMLGYDKEELLKKHFKDITFSEDVDKNLDLFRQMIAGKTDRYEMEKRYRSKDGRQIWCNLTASAIRGDNGELLQILALVDDISERKEAEEAIATSNRKVAEILESIQDGFFTMDRNWCFTYANTRAAANLGLKPEELLGQNLWEKFPVIKGTAHEIAYRKSMEDRVVQRFETKSALTDKWYDISVYPSGEGISVYWQDITEHKQSEEELQKSEHRYRTLFESIQEGFYLSEIIVDDDGRLNDYIYLDANKAFERIMGLTRDQIIGKRAKELVPDLKSDWLEVFNKVALTGEPARYNSYSEVFHRYFEIFVFRPGEGQFAVLVTDITERKQAEEVLRETKDYLENLINYANAPIIVWDTSFNITRFNQAFEQLTGLLARDVLGNPLEMLFPDNGKDESLELIRRTTAGERLDAVEIPILRTDRSVRTVLWNSANIYDKDGTSVVATIAQGQDITDRKRAEEQLRTTLESIGDGFFACDADWRFVYVNAPAERILDIRREEVLGKSHWEVFPLTLGTNLEREYRLAAAGEVRDFENFYEPWGRWFHNRCYPREGGGMSVYFEDITERKRAEEERERLLSDLAAEKARWQATVENMLDLVTVCDAGGSVTYINPAYLRLIGRPVVEGLAVEEHPGYYQIYRADGTLFTPEDLPLQKAAITGEEVHKARSFIAVLTDGSLLPYSVLLHCVTPLDCLPVRLQ